MRYWGSPSVHCSTLPCLAVDLQLTRMLISPRVHTVQVSNFLKEFQKNNPGVGEDMVAVNIWQIMMGSVEWTRKADLLEKEVLRFIKQNCKLLGQFTKHPKTQLALLVAIQTYCYENMDFMKVRGRFRAPGACALLRVRVLSSRHGVVVQWRSVPLVSSWPRVCCVVCCGRPLINALAW